MLRYKVSILLFHAIKEEKSEDTDSIKINIVKEEMDIEILPNDLDQSHCIGNHKKEERLIIVKFVRYIELKRKQEKLTALEIFGPMKADFFFKMKKTLQAKSLVY